eukprot:473779-Ditylum_brightwellii.AAC.1
MTRIFENKKKKPWGGIGIRTIIWYSPLSIAAVVGAYTYFFLIPSSLPATVSHRLAESVEIEQPSGSQGLRSKQEDAGRGVDNINRVVQANENTDEDGTIAYNKQNATRTNSWCEGSIPPKLREEYQQLWQEIDSITQHYTSTTGTKISGGLFLYPRQAALLGKLIQDLMIHKNDVLQNQAKTAFRICETGFGAGHSAAFFLSLSAQ